MFFQSIQLRIKLVPLRHKIFRKRRRIGFVDGVQHVDDGIVDEFVVAIGASEASRLYTDDAFSYNDCGFSRFHGVEEGIMFLF